MVGEAAFLVGVAVSNYGSTLLDEAVSDSVGLCMGVVRVGLDLGDTVVRRLLAVEVDLVMLVACAAIVATHRENGGLPKKREATMDSLRSNLGLNNNASALGLGRFGLSACGGPKEALDPSETCAAQMEMGA
ncbi:hypothetical protein ACLB2K_056181 [Fragaria x ananassa]